MWRLHRDERLAGARSSPAAPWRRGLIDRLAMPVAAALLALAAPAAAVAAQESRPPSEVRPVADVSLPALTVGEVVGNSGEHYGKPITVSGTVATILGPRAFTIADHPLLPGSEMPVVSQGPPLGPGGEPLDVASLAGQDVVVLGRVHQFDLAAFEDQLSVDLEDAHFAPWGGKPAIVADAVRPLGPDEPAWTGGRPSAAAPTDSAPAGRAGSTRPDPSRAPVAMFPQWVTVDQVLEHPGDVTGERVTVFGTVGEVFGPRIFALQDDDLLLNDELLVLSSRPPADRAGRAVDVATLRAGELRVTGLVRRFDLAAFEERLGIRLDDARLDAWEGRPALIADSIVPAAPLLYPTPFEGVQNVTVDGILDDPGRYMGATVSVRGPVEDVYGPRAFTVSDGDLLVDEDILVVTTRPMLDAAGRANDRAVSPDQEVVATGTLRVLDLEEVERTYGVALDDAALAEWAGKPVILATSVRADRR